MNETKVNLVPLTAEHREEFIFHNQHSFKFGAVEEFGLRDESFTEDGEIISRQTIESEIDCPENESYLIIHEGKMAGGLILKIDPITCHNHLEILFVNSHIHSKGIGFAAWQEVEKLHPETKIWETCTPYFEKRNIHFYINKCGFSAVEFFCQFHEDPNPPPEDSERDPEEGPDEMLRFIKVMK